MDFDEPKFPFPIFTCIKCKISYVNKLGDLCHACQFFSVKKYICPVCHKISVNKNNQLCNNCKIINPHIDPNEN